MADAIPVTPQTPKKSPVKKTPEAVASVVPQAPAAPVKAGVKLLSHDAIRIDY